MKPFPGIFLCLCLFFFPPLSSPVLAADAGAAAKLVTEFCQAVAAGNFDEAAGMISKSVDSQEARERLRKFKTELDARDGLQSVTIDDVADRARGFRVRTVFHLKNGETHTEPIRVECDADGLLWIE